MTCFKNKTLFKKDLYVLDYSLEKMEEKTLYWKYDRLLYVSKYSFHYTINHLKCFMVFPNFLINFSRGVFKD